MKAHLRSWESERMEVACKNFEIFQVEKLRIWLPDDPLLKPFLTVRVEEQTTRSALGSLVSSGDDFELVGEHRMALADHLPCNWYTEAGRGGSEGGCLVSNGSVQDEQLEKGSKIAVLSQAKFRRECTVLDDDGESVLVHYDGFDPRHDEWLARSSGRLVLEDPFGLHRDAIGRRMQAARDGAKARQAFREESAEERKRRISRAHRQSGRRQIANPAASTPHGASRHAHNLPVEDTKVVLAQKGVHREVDARGLPLLLQGAHGSSESWQDEDEFHKLKWYQQRRQVLHVQDALMLNMQTPGGFEPQFGRRDLGTTEGENARPLLRTRLERPDEDGARVWKPDLYFEGRPLFLNRDVYDPEAEKHQDHNFRRECNGFVKFAVKVSDGWADSGSDQEPDSASDGSLDATPLARRAEDSQLAPRGSPPPSGVTAAEAPPRPRQPGFEDDEDDEDDEERSDFDPDRDRGHLVLTGQSPSHPSRMPRAKARAGGRLADTGSGRCATTSLAIRSRTRRKQPRRYRWSDFATMSDPVLDGLFHQDEPLMPTHEFFKRLTEKDADLLPSQLRVRLYFVKGVCITGQTRTMNPYLMYRAGKAHTVSMKNQLRPDTHLPDFYRMEQFDLELPQDARLEIEMWSKSDDDLFGSDTKIGSSVIDLEDRWHSFRWRELMESRRVPKETRPLVTAEAPHLNKGTIELWVDMLQTVDASDPANQPVQLQRPPPAEIEVRIVIWSTRDVKCVDGDKSDVKISVTLDCQEYMGQYPTVQYTDTHQNCTTGEAVFNWRVVFDRILTPTSSCTLGFQVMDWNALTSYTPIGDVSIDIGKYVGKVARETDSIRLRSAELSFVDKLAENEDDADVGTVIFELWVLTQSEADARPQGIERQEPNDDPGLTVPAEGRSWAETFASVGLNFSMPEFGILKKVLPVGIFFLVMLVLLRWLGLL